MRRWLLAIIGLPLLYLCNYITPDWIDIYDIIPHLPENRGDVVNIAKKIARLIAFVYVLWRGFSYFINRRRYINFLNKATKQMTQFQIPLHVQQAVIEAYHKAWAMNKIKFPITGYEMHVLPKQLKYALVAYTGSTDVEKIQMYKDFSPMFFLLASVQMKYFSAGEIACKKGTVADAIYLVAHGIFVAKTDDGTHLETLVTGDVFGEIGVLHIDGYNVRTANVCSVIDSQAFVINQKDITKIINKFPETKHKIVMLGKKRLLRSKIKARYL